MSNPNDPADKLKRFYEHCSSHHFLLDTDTPMLDVAVAIMHHIENLNILFVSNKVKADLVRCVASVTKIQLFEAHLYVYIEPILIMLLDVMADENFRHEKLIELHASIMTTGASAATPFASGKEQSTPLTSNVSAPLQQNLLSYHNQKVDSSIQLSSIQEEPPVPDGGCVVGHIDQHVKVEDVIEEQVKVGASLSLAPVNLDQDFAAANSPDKSRLDPEEDEYCVLIDGPHKSPVAPNRSLSKYSLSDAWTRNNLTSSHSKFSGTSTSWHKFLQPELHCKQCSFPQSSTIILIGDQAYFNKCSNTTVWLMVTL